VQSHKNARNLQLGFLASSGDISEDGEGDDETRTHAQELENLKHKSLFILSLSTDVMFVSEILNFMPTFKLMEKTF
jgi:hypothetical protein